MIKVALTSPQDIVPIDRIRMREAALAVLEGEGIKFGELSLAFVDNATMRQLNQRYLQHDEPTDVLSFPLGEGKGRFGGEIVIGAEVAQLQAETRGHDINAELALYIIHGLLHLCDYDDATPAAAAEMRQRERHYLTQLGYPDVAPAEE